jgi:hypothetical protein
VTPTLAGAAPSQPTVAGRQYRPNQLGGLRRFALAITVFTLLGHIWFGFEQSYAQPLVSVATAYFTQLLLEALEGWAQGRRPGFTKSFGALVTSLLSAHISGLACAMLLYADDRLWVVCFASAVAIASKTLFRVPVGSAKGAWPLLLFQLVLFLFLLQTGEATSPWLPVPPQWAPAFRLGVLALLLGLATLFPRGVPTRHYLNPSNFGIAVTLLLFPSVGIAAPYQFTENLGGVGDWVVPMVIICTGSILNTWYTGRIHLALAWVGTFALQAVVSSLILWHFTGYCPIAARLSAMTGVAFILFTFYMVTDPATTPERPGAQVAFGASVALVYSLFVMSHVVFGLFAALAIVCVARGLGMYLLAWRRGPEPATGSAPASGPAPANVSPGFWRLRRVVTLLGALGLVGAFYLLSQPPALPATAAEAIAARFRFDKLPFPEPGGFPHKTVRQVHPSLSHLSSYLSALGASVALGDIDGDGLPNDLCYVDPRIDQVVIAPAPGTPPNRYEPFVLQPGPLPYDSTMAPTGCLLGDFNEDGLTDVLVCFWGRSPVIYLQQPAAAGGRGLTAQSFVPCELIEPCQRWFSCSATQADLDGDGHCDLVIGNYGPDGEDYLDPNGTGQQPMTESLSRSFNGGGPHFLLWKRAGGGKTPFVRFERVDPEFVYPEKADPRRTEEVCHGWTLALGAADLDGDGLPEVYVANDLGPDRLLHNRSEPGKLRFGLLEGERGFTTPRSRVLGQDSFKGMGIDFGDVNGDGWLDMYVSNISRPYSLYESHFLWLSTGQVGRMKQGVAPYYDAGEELGLARSGWGWDSRLADFDNDGVLEAVQAMGYLKGTVNRWPEMHELAATNDRLLSDARFWPDFRPGADFCGSDHNCFFVRAANGRFYDFSRQLGLSTPMVTRGIALADVDGDGRLDFAVANQWEPSFLFRNTAPNPGAFLGLHLRLPVGPETSAETVVLKGHPRADRPSRPAIGAAVTVHLPDDRRLVSQVDGGSGHSGKRAPDIHLGLGNVEAGALLNVGVRWRGADGKMRSQTLQLTPGWHTVLLGLEPSLGG